MGKGMDFQRPRGGMGMHERRVQGGKASGTASIGGMIPKSKKAAEILYL
jgi:hypothetical protein